MKFKIVLEKGLDGFIVVSCPALKGLHSQAKTKTEALKNIKEAILLYLEPNPKDVRPSSHHEILTLSV